MVDMRCLSSSGRASKSAGSMTAALSLFFFFFFFLLLPPCSPAYSERKTPKLDKASDVTHATTKERKNETEAADKTLNTRTEEKP
jgi:hypothetical protein